MKYYSPRNAFDLTQMLSDLPHENTVFLAGGTDLMPRWEQGTILPNQLIDLKKINGLTGIQERDNEITIGALTTVQDIKDSKLIQNNFTALSDAASQFAGMQIRHRATIGGNICNASPAGDLLPGLYAHGARVTLLGPDGERQMPISEFILGPGETNIRPQEILMSIKLPLWKVNSSFYKLGLRQTMAISVVNFAIVSRLNSSGSFSELTVAAGAVAPTVVYLDGFAGAIVDGRTVEEAIELVDDDINPIDDIRASTEYRRTALKNVLKYFIRHELHK